MLKKFLLIFCLFSIIIFNNCSAKTIPLADNKEKAPVQIAILPIISNNNNYANVKELLDKNLKQTMYIPLNDTLQTANYIDEDKISLAIYQSGFTHNQNIDTLKYTAELLNADVIVGYSIPTMYQRYLYFSSHLDGSPILNSYISLKLWAYYKPLDKVISLSVQKQYLDTLSTWGLLPTLADEASYTLNKKANLKNLLKQTINIKKGDL